MKVREWRHHGFTSGRIQPKARFTWRRSSNPALADITQEQTFTLISNERRRHPTNTGEQVAQCSRDSWIDQVKVVG
jgi:hypothetical protein